MDDTRGYRQAAFNADKHGKRPGNRGHSSIFTRAEAREAPCIVAPPGEVDGIIATLYDDPDAGPDFFYGDLLTARSASPNPAPIGCGICWLRPITGQLNDRQFWRNYGLE